MPAISRSSSGFGLVRVAATLAVVTILALGGRPLDESRRPATTRPPETVLVPASIDVPAPPPVVLPRAPRRAPSTTRSSPAAVAMVAPLPDLTELAVFANADVTVAALVVLELPLPLEDVSVSASIRTPRAPRSLTFAALPDAGLTQQTP